MSSSDDTTDDERIQSPCYPKIPQTKKDTRDTSTFYDKSKQQLKSK